MKHILRLFSPFFFIALVMNTMGRVQNSLEILEWSSTRINNKLPLLCKKNDLLNLLGKPDKILDPDKLDICTWYFDNNFNYLVWGQTKFESTDSLAVISSIDIEAGKIKLVSPKITLDSSVTVQKVKQLFPKSSKNAQELIIDDKGKVLSIKIAASNKNADDGWLLFFKAGKLVRVDYWIAC